MAVLMPFLMSMLLGRTIDLTSYSIGANIYDDIDYEEVPIYNLNATYHVLQGQQLPYAAYKMPMDMVLRIKATDLSSSSGTMGLDGLLKATSWMRQSAVVAVGVVYRTVERELRKSATLLPDWKKRISYKQTHYASSIIYGGWFSVLYRFKCTIPSDVKIVHRMLFKILGRSGTLGENTQELWKKIQQAIAEDSEIRGEVVVKPYVYTSVQLPEMIESIQSIGTVASEFPKIVGIGSPLHMKLDSLSKLDSRFPLLEKNEGSVKPLLRLDIMYDDVKQSRTSIMNWLKNAPSFDYSEEDKISDFLNTLTMLLKEQLHVINNVSLFVEPNRDAFKRIFDIYAKELPRGTPSYRIAYLMLKEDINTQCKEEFLRGIRGILDVGGDKGYKIGDVGLGGIKDCKKECLKDRRCRSVAFAAELFEIDYETGNYVRTKNQCWVYYRSTSTAEIGTPTGLSGELKVYDRRC